MEQFKVAKTSSSLKRLDSYRYSFVNFHYSGNTTVERRLDPHQVLPDPNLIANESHHLRFHQLKQRDGR